MFYSCLETTQNFKPLDFASEVRNKKWVKIKQMTSCTIMTSSRRQQKQSPYVYLNCAIRFLSYQCIIHRKFALVKHKNGKNPPNDVICWCDVINVDPLTDADVIGQK